MVDVEKSYKDGDLIEKGFVRKKVKILRDFLIIVFIELVYVLVVMLILFLFEIEVKVIVFIKLE